MNKEQQKIVEDNMNLVPFMIGKLGLGNMYDDIIDIGWIGLCNGALTFNSNISKLSTYLCTCIKNEILRYLQHINSPSFGHKIPVLSLDEEYILPNGEVVTLYDAIPSKHDIEVQFRIDAIKETFEDTLDECEYLSEYFTKGKNVPKIPSKKQMLCEYFGYKQPRKSLLELANKYNVSRTRCVQIITHFRKKCRKNLQKSIDI